MNLIQSTVNTKGNSKQYFGVCICEFIAVSILLHTLVPSFQGTHRSYSSPSSDSVCLIFFCLLKLSQTDSVILISGLCRGQSRFFLQSSSFFWSLKMVLCDADYMYRDVVMLENEFGHLADGSVR